MPELTRGVRRLAVPLAGLLVVLAALEFASRSELLPSASFPPVTEIFSELFRLAGTSEFWTVIGQTLRGWGVAMVVATAIAVPVGMLIGATRVGYLLTRVTIDFLRPVPSVALIPLLVLIFGTTAELKITLAVIGSVFPLLFKSMYAVRDVDPVAKDTARSFGLNPGQRVWRVVLPSCLPFVVTGLRISAAIALILVVTGEYVVRVEGIGRSVFIAQNSAAYPQMYAYVVAAGLIGVALNAAFQVAEHRILFWHPSQRYSRVFAAPRRRGHWRSRISTALDGSHSWKVHQ